MRITLNQRARPEPETPAIRSAGRDSPAQRGSPEELEPQIAWLSKKIAQSQFAWSLPRQSLCFLLALVLLGKARCEDQPKFDLAEVKSQWATARRVRPPISGSIQEKMTYLKRPSPDMRDTESTSETKANLNCISTYFKSSELTRLKNSEYVTAINPKYSFRIKRELGADSWAIDEINIGDHGSDAPVPFGDHFHIWEQKLTLERLFEKPNFRIIKVEKAPVDGSDMIRIEFDCPFPVEKRKDPGFHPVQGGVVTLDPQHYWCIKEYDIRTNDSVSIRSVLTRFEYSDGSNRFPILRSEKTTQHATHEDGKEWFVTQTDITYDLRESDNKYDDADFTLSAYGLPEPYGITWKRRTPTYVWLLIAAGVFAVAAVGLRFVAKRRARLKGS